ncbi:MAG: asparagine synthase (glutamine-hydrolyzing) [Chloroflexi bacterium]|nr:asparagine synthase (glutamine-hydrolyzing) [Chloroflexota bacterium]
MDDPNVLVQMCDQMTHRGPDDRGVLVQGFLGLAMRRLRIIDLKTGDQPIPNEDESIWVVHNGEIYNYLELRSDLMSRGHRFRTNSDSEVLVHLYEEYGTEMFAKLNGMFGFALWDGTKRELVVARDRLGKKPLHYAVLDGRLIFASEIKALLAYPGFPRRVNLEALNQLLTYNYIPAPLTVFQDVSELLPGHFLIARGGTVKTQAYWTPRLAPEERSEREWVDDILETLREATRVRLRSDVPLGAFLSGGVDSSSVVATMSALSDQPVSTFSIGFTDPRFDELPYARQVAGLFATDHHDLVVDPDMFIGMLERVIWHLDEPFGDASFLPTLVLSQLAKETVTVVLTGDGGDELFAGYERVRDFIALHPQAASPVAVAQQYADFTAVFNQTLKNRLLSGGLADAVHTTDSSHVFAQLFNQAGSKNPLDMILYGDIRSLLNNNNLVKPDRMAMAVALEARSPYLDPRMVDLSLRMPSNLKLRGQETKYILKKALEVEGTLPHEILYRKKQMFTVPIGEWFRDKLRQYSREILLDSRTAQRGYFNTATVSEMLDQHQAGAVNYTRQLRLLLTVELWHRLFIDRTDLVPPPAAETSIHHP